MSQRFPIDQDLRDVLGNGTGYECHRLDLQRRANHDKQIALVLVFGHRIVKIFGKTLAKEDNVRLHDRQDARLVGLVADCALDTEWNPLSKDIVLDCVRVNLEPTSHACGCGKGTMACDHPLDVSSLLQCVNVLGIVSQQLALLLDVFDEFVRGRWCKLAGVDFLQRQVH